MDDTINKDKDFKMENSNKITDNPKTISNSNVSESDKNKAFLKYIELSANKFKKQFIDDDTNIKIISHLDADGISAASIVIKMLSNMNINYSLSIVPEINPNILNGLLTDMYSVYILSDLGSGYLNDIRDILLKNGKKVLILDHHELTENDSEVRRKFKNSLIEVNPHLFEIDGSSQISGSGVSYFFAKYFDSKNMSMAHIAVVGATGDYQIDDVNSELNEIIIRDAISSGKLKVITGLKLFGAQTRPLPRVLSYCTDPYLPGITGSENGAVQFLLNIGINPKIGNKWKKLVNLTKSEMEKLVEGIVMMSINNGSINPNEIIGKIYILPNEERESPLRDVKEFATLLNACGRMNKASYGIGACLNEEKLKARALGTMVDYKKQIIKSLKWFENYKNDPNFVIRKEKYTIINARDNIYYTMIGTIASILSHSTDLPQDHIIIAMAEQYDLRTKVSIRISKRNKNDVNLKELIDSIISIIGGESGGHKDAAGAIIDGENEKRLIETAENILNKISIEEKVI